MPIARGTRLGPYEIDTLIGEGGMGEVYKAHDTRLDRLVAIKIVSEALAASPELRDRLDREARIVASLNHPHICTIHDRGRETPAGTNAPVDFLVMEYLEGETLADRLARGPLPLDQAMEAAVQIAQALDRAHRAGVVHRDLKPGNVFLARAPGHPGAPTVKLLDFGLAKLIAPQQAGSVSVMPTEHAPLTAHGAILGTFQYMSPEQVEGDEADARSDIFAFGVVLYEMLTGRRAFEGRTQASLVGAILKEQPPPVSTLQPLSSPLLDRIVGTCLAKRPDERWQTAGELLHVLRWVGSADVTTMSAAVPAARPRGRAMRAALVGVTALAIAAGALAIRHLLETPAPATPIRFQAAVNPTSAVAAHVSVSPDGRRIAYRARLTEGAARGSITWWVYSVGTGQSIPVPRLSYEASPSAWSPDSRTLLLASEGRLYAFDVEATSVRPIAPLAEGMDGLAVNSDGDIVFSSVKGNIFRVPATGGTPEQVRAAGAGVTRLVSAFLPDGRLLYVERRSDTGRPCVASIDGSREMCLAVAASAVAYAPGRLLFMQGDALLTQRFDEGRLSLIGDPVAVATGVRTGTRLPASASGSTASVPILAYFAGRSREDDLQPTWFNRDGRSVGTIGEPAPYVAMDLSPDGRLTVVSQAMAGEISFWLVDSARPIATRLATPDPRGTDIVWFPDSRRVVYQIPGRYVEQSAFGSTSKPLVEVGDRTTWIEDVSPDGRHLLIVVIDGTRRYGAAVPIGGGDELIVGEGPNADEFQFAPDGRAVAYNSGESGRQEVYIAPFPPTGERWQVSTSGGVQPRWRADSRELYYLAPDGAVMAVAITAARTPTIGEPRALFKTPLQPAFNLDQLAVSPDGQRFLLRLPVDSNESSLLDIVVNWTTATTDR